MERASFAILFYVRDSRIRKDGTAAIEVSLTVNGERSFFSTGKRVCVQNWDKTRQLVRGNSEESKSINKFLSAVKAKIYQKEAELIDRGFVITAELLRDAYFDKVESLKEHSLMSVLESHNSQCSSMVGKTIAKSTYFNFEHGGKLLKEYIQSKYGRNDLYLRELNMDFIQGFHAFLLNEKKMQQNTTTKHLKFLKKLLNIAAGIIHIATHAFYCSEQEIAEDGRLAEVDFIPVSTNEASAMNRCGLVFSGAGSSAEGNKPEGVCDGFVYGADISARDFRNAGLVVLSGCKTASGDVYSDGIYGLQRAFRYAGAGALIMSLWNVNDRSAALMMTSFYRFLMNGDSRHEAFRKARAAV